ncbi:hypothetical protein ACHAPA_004669 [Fusarium lateritium]
MAPIADENGIISSTTREIKSWDISTGHCKETLQPAALPSDPKFALATATNAPLYTTWSKDHIEVWHLDPTNGTKQLPQKYGNLAGLEDVTISANGERLAAILYTDDHTQYALKIWDVKSATLLQELRYDYNVIPHRLGRFGLAISNDGTRVVYSTPTTTVLQRISSPHSPAMRLLKSSRRDHPAQLAFHNDRIFVMRSEYLQSFDHKTGEEIERRMLNERIQWNDWHKSFIDLEAINGTGDWWEQPITDFTKPYYTSKWEHCLHRKGDDVLWLPADYIPHSTCVVGSTVVIGTVSGRVLFLYLRDQD